MNIAYNENYQDIKNKNDIENVKQAIKSGELYVSLSENVLHQIEKSFREIASKTGNKNRSFEYLTFVDIYIPYTKIVEWRNVLACFGYNKLASDLNFEFQYCLQG